MRLPALVASALLVAGCSSPGAAVARSEPEARVSARAPITSPSEAQARRTSRVDVVAEDAPLREVLDRIGRQVGWNLVCEPKAGDLPVTIRLFDLPWRDALELLLARQRCEAAPAGESTLYVTEPVRVTIRF
jgi:type II secretory pathway component HofQ